jgi:hypothetical protein
MPLAKRRLAKHLVCAVDITSRALVRNDRIRLFSGSGNSALHCALITRFQLLTPKCPQESPKDHRSLVNY